MSPLSYPASETGLLLVDPHNDFLSAPRAVNGPQHEHPEACAELIASFVRHSRHPPAASAA